MPRRSRLATLLVILLTFVFPTFGQPTTAPSAEEVEAAGRLKVYLLTMGPGAAVWEQFGHNAIQIVDPARDFDIACNWGVFDFFESGFYKRFIFGQMLYRMEVADGPRTAQYYQAENRSVYRQELDLSARQKAVLYQYVAWNSHPENREYRYDYYRDNCSTRVRDVIDRAVAGDIRNQLSPQSAGVSYRWHTRRIMAGDPIMYTALLYILGQPVDRTIDKWEESFLPLQLMAHLRDVKVPDDAGHLVPIVRSEETLYESTRTPPRAGPPNWVAPFLALGVLFATAFSLLTRYALHSRLARVSFILLATLWSFFIGGAGTFALWGWTSTEHVAVYRNENLLHFFPPALVLAALLPFAFRGRRSWLRTTARYLALAVPAASALGLLLKVFPTFYQVNYELIAWMLPAHVAFAYGIWRILSRQSSPVQTVSPSPVPAA